MKRICQRGLIVLLFASFLNAEAIPGLAESTAFGDQQLELRIAPQVRVLVNAPPADAFDSSRHTRFIFYALPNGNTIEWTLGCKNAEGLDWHYNIQHIGAQTRLLRDISPDENVVLFLLEADQRSWPAWRREHEDHAQRIGLMIDDLIRIIPHDPQKMEIVITGHSGGGSFTTGYLNGVDTIDPRITRIAYLDSNYSYDDEQHHGDKLLAWLDANRNNQLVVIAYDDREILYNGKKVVGPTGGTYRATYRMINRFTADIPLDEEKMGVFNVFSSKEGRSQFIIHPNPENRILHTALVGDMSGYLYAMTLNRDNEKKWGTFGPRDPGEQLPYAQWIQDKPQDVSEGSHVFPFAERPGNAVSGIAFVKAVRPVDFDVRETAIVEQFKRGNVPSALRMAQAILLAGDDDLGRRHSLVLHVMRDYLAVGDGNDALRMPMGPHTGQSIADSVEAMLPTARLSDHIHAAARMKLEPQPLTDNREAVATFFDHHGLIQEQLGRPMGEVLVAGIKKDVVVSNRLAERPNRVAIYGWHYPNGKPIQPLTTVHVDHYVDYSHGVRLVARAATLDGRPVNLPELLVESPILGLISSEGPLKSTKY